MKKLLLIMAAAGFLGTTALPAAADACGGKKGCPGCKFKKNHKAGFMKMLAKLSKKKRMRVLSLKKKMMQLKKKAHQAKGKARAAIKKNFWKLIRQIHKVMGKKLRNFKKGLKKGGCGCMKGLKKALKKGVEKGCKCKGRCSKKKMKACGCSRLKHSH